MIILKKIIVVYTFFDHLKIFDHLACDILIFFRNPLSTIQKDRIGK